MNIALTVAQIIVSILITASILLQAQGAGLGTTWAGGGETYHTKRGVERVVFVFTIICLVLFTVLSLANLFTQAK